MVSWRRSGHAVAAQCLDAFRSAQALGVLALILLMPWLCYCWASVAQIENFHVACCVMLVFGSYTQLPMARGTVGPAPAVVAFGTRREKWDLEELKAFEAGIKSQKGRVKRVLSFAIAESWPARKNEYEVLVFLDDENNKVALVKICPKEAPTVDRYCESWAPIGGKKLIDDGEKVPFVTIENVGKEHAFIEHVIECCSAKLDALPAFPAVCVEGGLNNTSRAFHYLSKPVNCPALEAILRAPQEVFIAASGRNLVIYEPPTLAQHTSTLKLIADHERDGTLALVHHQKNEENSKVNSKTWPFSRQAEMTDDKAVCFARDVLSGTLEEEYGVCQNGVSVAGSGKKIPLTPMQKMKAMLLSDPKNKEAIAYLKPRVGSVHVEKLQDFGRALKENEKEILALVPAASASKKRRV